jgi:hypothetical protein
MKKKATATTVNWKVDIKVCGNVTFLLTMRSVLSHKVFQSPHTQTKWPWYITNFFQCQAFPNEPK